MPGPGVSSLPDRAHSLEAKPQKRRNLERFRDLQHKFSEPRYVIVNLLTDAFCIKTTETLLRLGEFGVTLRDSAIGGRDRSV
jgi:hypothetical protein